jgi:iron(III) transport system ATP-binding protein
MALLWRMISSVEVGLRARLCAATIRRVMASVELSNISRRFGRTVALDDINLQIAAGELFFLLGPSGCGKSTLLRIIAGLLSPSSGTLRFEQRDVTRLPTERRNAVMCFQSYALWPHMTVRDNVGFGLGVRKVPAEQQQQRIAEVLRLVQMDALADRKPNQLSGGQQQRVALARALAVQPDCLLLDEPLSNLDAKLRLEMRSEIRRICKSAALTTIYVTHDQKEALSIADRIAVLKDGKLMQVGSPDELYRRPASAFVADFIGQTNLIPGEVVEQSGEVVRVKTAAGVIESRGGRLAPGRVMLSIRPEQMRIVRGEGTSSGANRLSGKSLDTTFLGEASEHTVQVDGQKLRVISTPPLFNPPEVITVEFDPEDVVVLAG